jgi:hypothetical protein
VSGRRDEARPSPRRPSSSAAPLLPPRQRPRHRGASPAPVRPVPPTTAPFLLVFPCRRPLCLQRLALLETLLLGPSTGSCQCVVPMSPPGPTLPSYHLPPPRRRYPVAAPRLPPSLSA